MTQRLYRAHCPNCGAPVEFRSAASAMAVCSYCSSTIVRDGETLRRIGVMAELFDDHSPIGVGASGRLPAALAQATGEPADAAFTVIGRLQYRYADGVWSEWSLLFDDGQTLWLSEDNGRYALGREQGVSGEAPAVALLDRGDLRPGQPLTLSGRRYEVSSLVPVTLQSAAGELPASAARVALPLSTSPAASQPGSAAGVAGSGAGKPVGQGGGNGAGSGDGNDAEAQRAAQLRRGYWMLEARATDGTVASLDYADPRAVRWSLGWPVQLADLRLQGLPDAQQSAAQIKGTQGFACPSCGAPVQVRLTGTQSIVCDHCSAVIDVTRGVGADLAWFRQQRRYPPAVALGSTGRLFDVDWQVVGFARRSGQDDDGYDFAWQELLLYNALEGFAFVVIASDGVSFVRTTQNLPEMVGGRGARYDGRTFRAESRYVATVDYVEGEFYWRVRAGQRTQNIDLVSGDRILSREEERFDDGQPGPAGGEVVWSYGQRVSSGMVARAFGLPYLPNQAAGAGTPIRAADGGIVDAPAYDPHDLPRGLTPAERAAALAAAAAARPAASQDGQSGSGDLRAASAMPSSSSTASTRADATGGAGAGAGAGAGGGGGSPGGPGAGGGGGAGGRGPGLPRDGGPTSGSRAVVWLIVVIVVILILVFLLAGPGGGGGGYYGGGYSGGGGFSGSHK